MATNAKNEAIVKIALEFWLDGNTLNQSLEKAQAEYKKANARSRASNEKQSTAQLKSTEAQTKLTLNKIERETRASNKKIAKENEQAIKAEAALKVSENKKALAKIAKDDAQAAKDRKKTFAGGFDNFDAKVGTISAYGAAIAVIGSLTSAVKFAITKNIEYEKSFVDLAVKSGYTNKELSEVKKEIYSVADATIFSTLQTAEAATVLSKLGFEANEVIDILPNLANVAGATGESLKDTADVFGTVINAYGYSSDNAQNIADRLIQTFNDSAMDLGKFATAFSYVGAAAASTGTSFDELTAGMAVLANRGVTASKIGTGLRNIFTELGREGDTLRDILVKVNEEQMSFYELAEIVGQRAANQLFILSHNIAEFDQNVADSSKKYGKAMEANAIQMSSFSAKWDIFMNNVTNKVTGSDADPLSEWRYNLKTSLDLFDHFNSLNIMNKKGSEMVASNFLNANQKLFQEIRELKAKNKDMTEEEMSKILLAPYDFLGKVRERGWLEKKLTAKQEAAWDEKEAIQQLFAGSDGNDIFTAIDIYVKGKMTANKKAAQESYLNTTKSFSEFVAANAPSVMADKLRSQILANDQADARKTFDEIFAGTEKYQQFSDKLNKLFATRGDLTAESANAYFVSSSGKTARESFEKALKELDERIKSVKGNMPEDNTKGSPKDIANLNSALENRRAFVTKWCTMAKDQPFLNEWLVANGIICEKSKSGYKKKGEIGKFDKNEQALTDYKVEKDLLDKQYNIEDDPTKKAEINQKLIDLEVRYLKDLNLEYKTYLDEQAVLRVNFAKRFPDDVKDFDLNVKNVQDSQIKDIGASEIEMNTYENRDLKSKVDAYKEAVNKRAQYELDIARIDEESKLNENESIRVKEEILARKNKIVADYYDDAEKDLGKHSATLMKMWFDLSAGNWNLIAKGLQPIDLEDLEKTIKELPAQANELKEKEIKDKGHLGKKDGKAKDFDYFGATMETIDDVYALYSQIGDMKLEMIKLQVEAELAVIQSRYDREAEIRNSALSSGIISQEQAFEAEKRASKKKIDEENKVNKKLFDAQKKRDKEDAIFTGLSSLAQAIANIFAKHAGNPIAVGILTSISAGAIAASTAMNIKAISSRKFVPQKYADGGIVEGKSHAQGGVPFTVKGRSGYEMEGGEFVVNKEATKEHLAELIRINGKTKANKRYLATGGVITAESTSDEINKAILDALSRPVRAYVTDQDLAKSESERRALTKKTSY